jgi:hypothetical protein
VGRHNKPEEVPPPKNKPRYRFVVAFSAIFALAFASMGLVAAIFPQRGPQAQASPGNPFPPLTDPPTAPPDQSEAAQQGPPGPLTGRFQVSQDWGSGFIGSVQLTNPNQSPQGWQVALVFPDNVGELQSSWIADGPGESTASRTGQTVTFSSSVPLAAGAHIGVFFQFGKSAGRPEPSSCQVNGTPCG